MKSIKTKYKPTRKQKIFHSCPADEVLFGGAAGGGKTVALVMDAFDYAMRYPNASIVLFRRSYPELEETLIKRAKEFYPTEIGKYNESKKYFTFINGSKILFRYLEKQNDILRYQGAEFDYIGFDELTHFSQYQFEYMKSRLRSAKGYPTYIRTTSNPDPKNPQNNEWVKKYFVKFAPPFKIKRDEIGRTRCYIPASVYDNPYLLRNDPDYVRRLESLPEEEKQALLYGNWDVELEGLIYNNFDFDKHVKDLQIKPSWYIFAGLDFGATNPTAVVFIATDGDIFYVFDEIYTPEILDDELAREIKIRNPREVYADPSGKGRIRELRARRVNVKPADNDVMSGIFKVKEIIKDNRLFISPKSENTLLEIKNYRWAESKDKPLKAFDHAMDALRYAIKTYSNLHKDEQDKKDMVIMQPKLEQEEKPWWLSL